MTSQRKSKRGINSENTSISVENAMTKTDVATLLVPPTHRGGDDTNNSDDDEEIEIYNDIIDDEFEDDDDEDEYSIASLLYNRKEKSNTSRAIPRSIGSNSNNQMIHSNDDDDYSDQDDNTDGYGHDFYDNDDDDDDISVHSAKIHAILQQTEQMRNSTIQTLGTPSTTNIKNIKKKNQSNLNESPKRQRRTVQKIRNNASTRSSGVNSYYNKKTKANISTNPKGEDTKSKPTNRITTKAKASGTSTTTKSNDKDVSVPIIDSAPSIMLLQRSNSQGSGISHSSKSSSSSSNSNSNSNSSSSSNSNNSSITSSTNHSVTSQGGDGVGNGSEENSTTVPSVSLSIVSPSNDGTSSYDNQQNPESATILVGIEKEDEGTARNSDLDVANLPNQNENDVTRRNGSEIVIRSSSTLPPTQPTIEADVAIGNPNNFTSKKQLAEEVKEVDPVAMKMIHDGPEIAAVSDTPNQSKHVSQAEHGSSVTPIQQIPIKPVDVAVVEDEEKMKIINEMMNNINIMKMKRKNLFSFQKNSHPPPETSATTTTTIGNDAASALTFKDHTTGAANDVVNTNKSTVAVAEKEMDVPTRENAAATPMLAKATTSVVPPQSCNNLENNQSLLVVHSDNKDDVASSDDTDHIASKKTGIDSNDVETQQQEKMTQPLLSEPVQLSTAASSSSSPTTTISTIQPDSDDSNIERSNTIRDDKSNDTSIESSEQDHGNVETDTTLGEQTSQNETQEADALESSKFKNGEENVEDSSSTQSSPPKSGNWYAIKSPSKLWNSLPSVNFNKVIHNSNATMTNMSKSILSTTARNISLYNTVKNNKNQNQEGQEEGAQNTTTSNTDNATNDNLKAETVNIDNSDDNNDRIEEASDVNSDPVEEAILDQTTDSNNKDVIERDEKQPSTTLQPVLSPSSNEADIEDDLIFEDNDDTNVADDDALFLPAIPDEDTNIKQFDDNEDDEMNHDYSSIADDERYRDDTNNSSTFEGNFDDDTKRSCTSNVEDFSSLYDPEEDDDDGDDAREKTRQPNASPSPTRAKRSVKGKRSPYNAPNWIIDEEGNYDLNESDKLDSTANDEDLTDALEGNNENDSQSEEDNSKDDEYDPNNFDNNNYISQSNGRRRGIRWTPQTRLAMGIICCCILLAAVVVPVVLFLIPAVSDDDSLSTTKDNGICAPFTGTLGTLELCNIVTNAIVPIHPNSTYSHLFNPTKCQFQTLDWLIGGSTEANFDVITDAQRIQQRYAMALLYCEFYGPGWFTSEIHLIGDDHECSWTSPVKSYGDNTTKTNTTVCNDNDEMIAININGNINEYNNPKVLQLSGTLPPELSMITTLKDITIANHGKNLFGTIPIEFGTLRELTNLVLSSNQLNWTVPDFVYDISHVDLSNNALTGTLPSLFPSKVEQLSLSTTQYETPNDDDYYYKYQLRSSHNRRRQLTRKPILREAESQEVETTPKVLLLHKNKFSGTISLPDIIHPYMEELTLHNNAFSGEIIALTSIDAGKRLQRLTLFNNFISGNVSAMCPLLDDGVLNSFMVDDDEVICDCCTGGINKKTDAPVAAPIKPPTATSSPPTIAPVVTTSTNSAVPSAAPTILSGVAITPVVAPTATSSSINPTETPTSRPTVGSIAIPP